MRAKGLLSVVMTGAMMMGVLSGCGFEPDITWTDTANGSETSYKVTVVVAHDGKLNIKSEQTVKDGDTLNFIATPSKDGDHRITGLMIDGVRQTYTGELPHEGEVKISLENINQDMTVVVLCDNETGGLGGVDGAVTGLEGSGSGSNGSSGSVADQPEEFLVSASYDATEGTVSVEENKVDEGDDATIKVKPASHHVIEDVTATVDGHPATVVDNHDGTYTVEDVEGDVEFIVTFNELPIEQVTLKGTPKKKTYDVGDQFNVEGLIAVIEYSDGNEEKELTADNTTVNPATLNAATESVIIQYSGKNLNFNLSDWEVTVTPTDTEFGTSKYLTAEDVEGIQNVFAAEKNRVGVTSGVNGFYRDQIWASLQEQKSLEGKLYPQYGSSKVPYTFSGKIYEDAATSAEKVEEAIKTFVDKSGEIKDKIGPYDDGQLDMFMLIDGEDLYIWLVW